MTEPDRYSERVAAGVSTAYEGRLLHREHSSYQLIEVYENPTFGRMLMLDGLAQTSERDEFMYHEMLVHVPLLCHPEPRRVLVIGGGDGGTLRRVLEHPTVERAVMVEIDERVTAVSRQHLPTISAAAFDDPRADVRFADGAAFVRESAETFDAVLIDSSDPVGPGVVLFRADFYRAVRDRLRPGGLLCAQSGSPLYQHADLHAQVREVAHAFADVRVFLGHVPLYPGIMWSYTLAGEGIAPDADTARQRAAERGLRCRYWSPETHRAAFALPQLVRDAIASERPQTWAAG